MVLNNEHESYRSTAEHMKQLGQNVSVACSQRACGRWNGNDWTFHIRLCLKKCFEWPITARKVKVCNLVVCASSDRLSTCSFPLCAEMLLLHLNNGLFPRSKSNPFSPRAVFKWLAVHTDRMFITVLRVSHTQTVCWVCVRSSLHANNNKCTKDSWLDQWQTVYPLAKCQILGN